MTDATGDLLLRTAPMRIVENDDVTRAEVMLEICQQLAPFQSDDGTAIVGATVISKDLTIDSLAVMDMVMELEDRFDVSIPMNVVAEIHTVDELADTILALRARN
jgi:acyl carrier protein